MHKLFISNKKEILVFNDGYNKVEIDLPLFGIGSALLRAFLPVRFLLLHHRGEIPPPDEIYKALCEFYCTFQNKDSYGGNKVEFDKAYIPDFMRKIWSYFCGDFNSYGNAFWYFMEVECYRQAIEDWLTPKKESEHARVYLKPREMFVKNSLQKANVNIENSWLQHILDSHNLESYPKNEISKLINDFEDIPFVLHHEKGNVLTSEQWQAILFLGYQEFVFRHRTSQAGTEIFVNAERNGEIAISYSYNVKGLLPLAWVELMWAVDHDIYAHDCQICGGIFEITRPYKRKSYTCPGECKKQQEINRMGGEEKKREYFRNAKKESRDRIKDYQRLKNMRKSKN